MSPTLPAKFRASKSKSEQAYLWIRDKILSGQYTPGYRLVLATLAEELGMSVVPVREAVRKLEAEDLVNYQRNVGACVKMIDKTRYADAMEALAVLEGVGTAKSAPYLTPKQIQRARDVNNELEELLADFNPVTFTKLNQQFHAALMVACPNARLSELVATEWERLGNLRETTFTFVPKRAQQSVVEHNMMLELIENKAPQSAIERAVRDHRMATVDAYLTDQ